MKDFRQSQAENAHYNRIARNKQKQLSVTVVIKHYCVKAWEQPCEAK